MSRRSDDSSAALPFFGGSDAGGRGPGSVLDHPGGPLYAPLPQSAASSATYSYASGYDEEDDLPPPPPEWLAPAPVLPAADRRTPNVILPPFKPKRPAAWFAQCEDLFRMRGIADQRDMFALCYNMLGDEQQEQVDDIAEQRPRPLDAFFRLRDRLVASHSLDMGQRVEQLLALPALGGQRPSALLAQMRQLCPQGEEAGFIFRQLFLQRLPSQVRLQLAEDRHSPVQALAARADTLMAHHSYGSVAAVSGPAQPEQDTLVAAVQDSKKPNGKDRFKRKQGCADKAAGGQQHPWELLGICKRHYEFGKECYKCADPASCKWAAGN